MPYIHYHHTPIGILQITAEDHYIIGVVLCTEKTEKTKDTKDIENTENLPKTAFLQTACKELTEYFAVAVGNPKAVRAIGQANHKNPILLLVPCHRVINKNGSIGGFGCGVEVKKQLLRLEGIEIN